MKLSGPRPLDARHRVDAFDCGKPALTDWLLRHARQAQGRGSARTFVSVEGEDGGGRVAGYHSLTVGQIDTLDAPERVRKGMGQYPIPVVILARLAVDRGYQGSGLGWSLLQDAVLRAVAVSEEAGIRALLTHPIDTDAAAFYRRFGFESTPHQQRQLILLLKDARRLSKAT